VREWLGGMQYPSEFPRGFNITDIPAEDEHSGDGVENPLDGNSSDGFLQDPVRAMTTNGILEKAWLVKYEAVMAMRPSCTQLGTTQPGPAQQVTQPSLITTQRALQPHWTRQEVERLLSIAHQCLAPRTGGMRAFKGSLAAELYNAGNGLATKTADELRRKWVVLVRTQILSDIITEIMEKNEKENITNIDLSEYYNEKGDMKRKKNH